MINKIIFLLFLLVSIFSLSCKEKETTTKDNSSLENNVEVVSTEAQNVPAHYLPLSLPMLQARADLHPIFMRMNEAAEKDDTKKGIEAFQELEQYAEGDEKIAVHYILGDNYSVVEDYENAIKYWNIAGEESGQLHAQELSNPDITPQKREQLKGHQLSLRETVVYFIQKVYKDKYTLTLLLEREKGTNSYDHVSLEYAVAEIYKDKGDCNKAIEYYNLVINFEGITNIRSSVLAEIDRCQNKLDGKE